MLNYRSGSERHFLCLKHQNFENALNLAENAHSVLLKCPGFGCAMLKALMLNHDFDSGPQLEQSVGELQHQWSQLLLDYRSPRLSRFPSQLSALHSASP